MLELKDLGFEVAPSHANFVFATVPGGNAKQIYDKLKLQHILVRFWDKPGLNDKIRITIGTSQEINALLAGLKELVVTERPKELV